MNNRHPVTLSRALGSPRYLIILITLAFFAIYTRTSAPSVLSGDSAEFQLAAATLGVAHPTTYPLYTLLGYLATILVPFGDRAWRVTFVTAGCAALAVGMFCALALRLGVSRRAALIGTIALGVTPGLWNAATVAEVYALLALLMVVLGYVVSYQPSAISHQLSAISREKSGVRRYSAGSVREPPVQVVAKQLIPQHREKTLIGSWFSVHSSAVLQFGSSRLSA
ncbi:MAG: DUF2723 domain-containing protein, partial [Roseiflexaceae bacterium]|nr:DUF2723 domain-containing protein [Roseiflexaceae bacterium]